jgi:hypothetical protein
MRAATNSLQGRTALNLDMEGDAMLRLVIATGLICLSTASFAQVAFSQVVQEVKATKFGGGCETRATTLAPKLGTCKLSDNKARVWCPNGKVFERSGPEFQPALARSICGMNQVL